MLTMDTQKVIDHLGAPRLPTDRPSESAKMQRVANTLGYTRQAVENWQRAGEFPPGVQAQVELATAGRFKCTIRPWEG